MKLVFHKNFTKDYKKLVYGRRKKADECLRIFIFNPFHPLLNNHPLSGKYEGYRSINITGDIRAIYKKINEGTVLFIAIGTHNSLYE